MNLKNVIFFIMFSPFLSSQKIVRIYVKNYADLQKIFREYFDKYSYPEIAAGKPGEWYDLIVNESQLRIIQSNIKNYEIRVPDLEKQKEIVKKQGGYHSYDEVVAILKALADSNPSIVKVESIGPSYEGRWIYGVKISDNVEIDEEEPEQLFSGCHHAREWASVEVPLFLAESLVNSYGIVQEITDIINNREIWIFPIINVDGYVYDYSNGGVYWRKNREIFHDSIGTDLNRNYNGICDSMAIDGWGMIPVDAVVYHNPGQDVFCGAIQFSGDAIKAYSDFIKSRKFVSIIDYHSYSELVLAPWGHKTDTTPHDPWYNSIGAAIAQRIQALGGGTYTYEKSISLYPTTGGSSDWQYGWYTYVNGTPSLAFVIEIGTDFYQPVSDLPTIRTENFKGAFYLLQKGDSIYNYMKTYVPSPVITSPTTDTVSNSFTLIWKPINKFFNNPLYYEIQMLRIPNSVSEDFEISDNLWITESFSRTTTRSYSGTYSLFSGNVNNIQAQARTKYPYYVKKGDSLKFWIYYDTEFEWDVATVEISENKREWFPLLSERWTGISGGWVKFSFDLSPWEGKTVYFRWRYMTDPAVLEEGVYIDDIYPVASWDTIKTVATGVTDTFYVFSNLNEGEYYFRVRGYSSLYGWGNWSSLKKVYVSSLTGSRDTFPDFPQKQKRVFFCIIPGIVRQKNVLIKIFGIEPEITLMNEAGRIIYKNKIKLGSSGAIFYLRLDKKGTYFYRVKFMNGKIQKGKIIKIE